MKNAIKIRVFENRAYFTCAGVNNSDHLTFICEDVKEYSLNINKQIYTASDHVCCVPKKSFIRGQNHIGILRKDGIPCVAVETIERTGSHVFPGGIDNKRFVSEICRRLIAAEQKVRDLSKVIDAYNAEEENNDLFSL